jgi:hypothetical protein
MVLSVGASARVSLDFFDKAVVVNVRVRMRTNVRPTLSLE